MKGNKFMKKKILALSLAFVLVVSATFGITLAWLTHTTGKIQNTFTVGKVSIELYEIDAADNELGPNSSSNEGEYKIVPGTSQKKQPYVEVASDSEACFVFIAVKNNLGDKVTYEINGFDPDDYAAGGYWEEVEGFTSDDGVELYLYRYTVDAEFEVYPTLDEQYAVPADIETTKLFDEVTYSKDLSSYDVSQLNGKTIEIKAFAIQSANLSLDAARTQAKTWANGAFKD